MKNLKKLALLSTATLALSASAATTTSAVNQAVTSLSDLRATLKESPLSLSYSFEISPIHKENSKGFATAAEVSHFSSLGYKINDTNSINAQALWEASYQEAEATNGQLTYAQLNYYKSGLLTEDKNGINATFVLRQRFYTQGQYKSSSTNIGYTRPGISISKSLTDNLSFGFSNHVAVYNRNGSVRQDGNQANNYYFYSIPSLSYAMNDKVSFDAVVEYIRFNRKQANNQSDSLDLTLGANYQLASALGTSFSVGMPLSSNTDNSGLKIYNPHYFSRDLSYTLGLSLSVF